MNFSLNDLASYTLEKTLEYNIDLPENNHSSYINKSFKTNFDLKFSDNVSNQFKVNGLLFQLKIDKNVVKLYGSATSVYQGELHDKRCNDYICDLYYILSSSEIKTSWKYKIGNYSCSRFSPMQLQKYANNNLSSLYKVVLDNQELFPNGVKKSKIDNSLVIDTQNGGFIKFYQDTENKPLIVLDEIKKAKSIFKNYLDSKISDIDLHNHILAIELEKLRLENQNKLRDHAEITKLKIYNITKDEKQSKYYQDEIKRLKEYYQQKLIDDVNQYTIDYCLENSVLINLLPYDNNYLLGVQNVQNNVRFERFKAIKIIKDTINIRDKNIERQIYSLQQDHDNFKQDLIASQKRLRSKIEKYLIKIVDIKNIDINTVFNTFESKIKANQSILTVTLDQPKSIKYRNDQNEINKLTANQIKRSITRTLKNLISGDNNRNLRLIGNISDFDHLVNTAKIQRDFDNFPIILSSKLSNKDYKTQNNSWLHDLNLTLIDY
jgi:hypothetical protein